MCILLAVKQGLLAGMLHKIRRNKKNQEQEKGVPFLTVSISAPARRAALTAFSSFLAAALGAFFLITTGSQSCEIGPTPDMAICSDMGISSGGFSSFLGSLRAFGLVAKPKRLV